MTLANYRYLLTGPSTTGKFAPVYAELPLINVQWSESLNEPGELSADFHIEGSGTVGGYDPSGTFNVYNTQLGTASAQLSITPGNTCLFVERNGIIHWGGIVWGRSYDSESQMIRLNARDFLSALEKQRVPIFTPIVCPQGQDVNAALKQLFGSMTRDVYGVDYSTLNNVLGIGLYDTYVVNPLDNTDYMSIISDLAKQGTTSGVQHGFDFGLTYGLDAVDGIYCYFNTFYPRRGRQAASGTGSNPYLPALTFPGSIVTYTYNEDGGGVVNDLTVFGPGNSDGQYVKRVTDTSGSAQYPTLYPWPQIAGQMNLSQIPNPLVVDNMAAAEVQARKTPVVTMEITWSNTIGDIDAYDSGPTVDDITVGDEFRIIVDDAFLTGFDKVMRLTRFIVSVGDDGQPENVTGTFVQSGTY